MGDVKTESKAEKIRRMVETLSSFAGAVIYGLFAFSLLADFLHTLRISDFFMLIFSIVFAGLFLFRSLPQKSNRSLYDWYIAFFGTYVILLLRPLPQGHDSIVLPLVQLAGLLLATAGLLSLNKSVGLVAANRGIKTDGMYKFLRHPIYAGYLIQFMAFWGQNITSANTAIVILSITFEMLRIFAEEECLSKDPAYQVYMKKVRWRIIPYVF